MKYQRRDTIILSKGVVVIFRYFAQLFFLRESVLVETNHTTNYPVIDP